MHAALRSSCIVCTGYVLLCCILPNTYYVYCTPCTVNYVPPSLIAATHRAPRTPCCEPRTTHTTHHAPHAPRTAHPMLRAPRTPRTTHHAPRTTQHAHHAPRTTHHSPCNTQPATQAIHGTAYCAPRTTCYSRRVTHDVLLTRY